jgi:hypothetical protein
MDKAGKIFLGALAGIVVYAISDPTNAIIYGTLTFIVMYLISG